MHAVSKYMAALGSVFLLTLSFVGASTKTHAAGQQGDGSACMWQSANFDGGSSNPFNSQCNASSSREDCRTTFSDGDRPARFYQLMSQCREDLSQGLIPTYWDEIRT
jgi:hypothetical protein